MKINESFFKRSPKEIFGDNPELVCECIATLISANEGHDVVKIAKDLGLSDKDVTVLSKALSNVVSKSRAVGKVVGDLNTAVLDIG